MGIRGIKERRKSLKMSGGKGSDVEMIEGERILRVSQANTKPG